MDCPIKINGFCSFLIAINSENGSNEPYDAYNHLLKKSTSIYSNSIKSTAHGP
jgi:hypothetical protein